MRYEDEISRAAMQAPMPQDKQSLGQEMQSLHKLISVWDEMTDTLVSKIEPVLSAATPHPAPNDVLANNPGQCALRDELLSLQNRMNNQLARLGDILSRIDT